MQLKILDNWITLQGTPSNIYSNWNPKRHNETNQVAESIFELQSTVEGVFMPWILLKGLDMKPLGGWASFENSHGISIPPLSCPSMS